MAEPVPERPHYATPAWTAISDQIHATFGEYIDEMVAAYRSRQTKGASVDIAGLSEWLQAEGLSRETLAELLAVAVVRLAERERS